MMTLHLQLDFPSRNSTSSSSFVVVDECKEFGLGEVNQVGFSLTMYLARSGCLLELGLCERRRVFK